MLAEGRCYIRYYSWLSIAARVLSTGTNFISITGEVWNGDCNMGYLVYDYCNYSCLELGSTLHHVQLQLLHVLYWVVTSTLANVGVEKTRGMTSLV